LEDLWFEVGPCLAMTRVRLHEALVTGAVSIPHRLGVSLTNLMQDDDVVRVGLSDGASEEYDLVVGADGIHSTVRALAVGSFPPSYAGQMAWRSVITSRPHGIVDNMMVLMGDGCFFGVVPMGDGYTYGFGAVDAERFEDPLQSCFSVPSCGSTNSGSSGSTRVWPGATRAADTMAWKYSI